MEDGTFASRRAAAALLLAVLGAGALGCELLHFEKVSLGTGFLLENPSDKKSDRDRYFEFRGKSKFKPGVVPPPPPPFGTGVAPLYLYEPFQANAVVGVLDPSKLAASANASGCIELDEKGTFGQQDHFFVLCARYETTPLAGMRVYTIPGTAEQFYPGVYTGTLGFDEASGSLDFTFKPSGGGTPSLIDTQAFPNPTGGWFPSFGASNLYKGGVIDFNGFDWTNGPLPSATPEETVARGFENSMLEMNHACGAVDGFDPDPIGAAAFFQSAFGFITLTRSQLSLLTDPKLERKVEAKLDCLDRNAGKANQLVLSASYDSAISKINKGLRCGGDALIELRDFKVKF